MIKSVHTIRLVFFWVFLALSCEKITFVVEADNSDNRSWKEEQTGLEENGLRSELQYRHSSMSEEQYQGALNAVKKAYQLTDITFTPLRPIAFNKGVYQPDSTYQGMIYSSVKEIGTYIGTNISFHTFMTAVHNPRSKIYSERIDKSPYHGTNCRSYYGTVCSGLVSYALGLFPIYASYDFVTSSEMDELDYSNLDCFHIADVLWRTGHVAIITNVIRDSQDRVMFFEVSEGVQAGCKRYIVSRQEFNESFSSSFAKILRYNQLEKNINYIPVSEFVAVLDETPIPFVYNNDICVDKGDKSCYFVGEDVTLNILSDGDIVEIYKDGVFHSTINVETEDIKLSDLDYGLYQARVMVDDRYSDFTSWVVVDRFIVSSKKEMRVYFKSENSIPVSISFCDKTGGRSYPISEILCKRFTEEEIVSGFIDILQEGIKTDRPYFMVSFESAYGTISTTPIRWE